MHSPTKAISSISSRAIITGPLELQRRCGLRLGHSHSEAWIIHTRDADLNVYEVQDSSFRKRRGMLLPEDRAPAGNLADEEEEMAAEEDEEEKEV